MSRHLLNNSESTSRLISISSRLHVASRKQDTLIRQLMWLRLLSRCLQSRISHGTTWVTRSLVALPVKNLRLQVRVAESRLLSSRMKSRTLLPRVRSSSHPLSTLTTLIAQLSTIKKYGESTRIFHSDLRIQATVDTAVEELIPIALGVVVLDSRSSPTEVSHQSARVKGTQISSIAELEVQQLAQTTRHHPSLTTNQGSRTPISRLLMVGSNQTHNLTQVIMKAVAVGLNQARATLP